MLLTQHFTYKEATYSPTAIKKGIANIPNERQLANIKRWAVEIFEPVRARFGVPVYVASCFRSERLNKVIGGANGSQHMAMGDCAAGDLDADVYGKITNADIFYFIKSSLLFDQLIWEFGDNACPDWVHVSHALESNRKQVLKAIKHNGETIYQLWGD